MWQFSTSEKKKPRKKESKFNYSVSLNLCPHCDLQCPAAANAALRCGDLIHSTYKQARAVRQVRDSPRGF